MKKVCVFTGAAAGTNPTYKDAAYQLGQMIGSRGLGLVYGGGKQGLMGAVADGVLAVDGRVTGIIPQFLDNVEVGHKGVTDLHIIDSMHERKAMMYDMADAFIILPGGLGTLDETMEIITWRQLGLHKKPIIIVNLNGYWDSMLTMFQNIIDQGFMHHGHTGHFDHVDDLDSLMDQLDTIFPPDQTRI
ncbi:MAG: TIGR00730 family Rossman fold protein [Proteobacteria bacterium]|nr:TIGR00730 family Rossman fold protein [Pseudomonadota bacterium]MDA0960311.1 TIGR00730 family Rossman fold protein [Pseudomonadota bacterium]MDA1153033.1 TIGR00730 family Rossman fold protein [Pseudomonadota bacterium]